VKNTLSIFGRAMMASLASFPPWTWIIHVASATNRSRVTP
jgi:hypothetical protein